MPRAARQLANSGIYHVMLRGVNRDAIFLDDSDRDSFLNSLAQAKSRSDCLVLAYCLMSNHAHLLLRTRTESIGLTIKRLGVSYAGRFNRRYGRVGHLFQGRFRSLPVEDDSYFVTVARYIWHNPVAAGLVSDPADYSWNSCSPHRPAALVDDTELDRLLPSLGRAQLSEVGDPATGHRKRLGRRPRCTALQAVQILEGVCGAQTPEEFRELDAPYKARAIRELRTRQVPYAVIGQVTGLAKSTVQRLQFAA